jgi:hypothetical protein
MRTDGMESTTLTWVREVAGQPRVRWRRIAAFMASFAAINFLGTAIVSQFSEMPLNPAIVLAPLCMVAAYLVLAIELQRQRLTCGNWRFRFSLRTILVLTAIAAIFFAIVANAERENQRLFAVNQTLKIELEAVMRGGTAWIGMPGGRQITCEVTRSSFCDDDLAKIVELASDGGNRACELSTLFLGGTGISGAGVCKLATCKKLSFVDLPPMNLSDEAIDALAKCPRLEFLVIDERRLSSEQLDRLRRSLPNVRLNGTPINEP